MIWFAWRQFRWQALVAFVLLLALGIAFLITGPGVVHYYDTVIRTCQSHDDCNAVTGSFLSRDPFLQNLLTESGLLAVLIGIFWGAPIVAREFDTGTYRLAWTQSASRTRWLGAKLLVGALASVLTAGLFTLMATWWSSPIDRVRGTPFSLFDTRDIVPIGYALFAFVLGVAVGAVIRRTIPAMAITIAIFAAVRGCFNLLIRPHFESPLHVAQRFSLPFGNGSPGGGDAKAAGWTLSNRVVNTAGKVFPQLSNGFNINTSASGTVTITGLGRCPNRIPNALRTGGNNGPNYAVRAALRECVNSFHLFRYTTYQPANRYWPFQWDELGCYVVLSALLAAFSIWWIRRR
ncbi:MAG: hypothetical protein WCA31_01730 [Acidimicrobiales bacterium]